MNSFHGNTFQQTAINLELFREQWTVRSNITLPVGPITRNIVSQNAILSNQPVFQGNQIGTQIINFSLDETAMRGIDVEIARSIGPWNGEVFVGYHNFDGDIGPKADGAHGGYRGNLAPDLAMNIGVSDDPVFGTNVFGGFTWFFGGGGGNGVAPRTVEEKMTIPVVREQQIVINEVQTQDFNFFQPLTSQGQIITFNHINSGATNGNGTFENPFGTLTEADLDPDKNNRNVVYVHSGSTFNNEGYALAPNQRILGEGDNNTHFIQTDQLGQIPLPQVNGHQFARPQITNAGTALFANDNTQISNLRIQNSNRGIAAANVGGNVDVNRTVISGGNTGIDIIGGMGQFTFSDVTINGSSVAGIRANDMDGNVIVNRSLITGGSTGIDIIGGTGQFTFSDVDFEGQSDTGINIDGGDSVVTFDSQSGITQSAGGSSVQVRGGHNGRLVFDPGSRIDSTSGDGLQFDDADGVYDFRGQVQLNGGDAGIDILGDSAGTFTFTDTTITDPTGYGINIDGGSSNFDFTGTSSVSKNNTGSTVRVAGGHTGTVTFDTGTNVTATNGDGLQFDNADGTYNFDGVTTLNGGDAGIDILGGSAGTFTFSDTTTITNPTGSGFKVQDLEAGGTVNYNGSIQNDNDVFIEIDTTAAGTQVNFNNTGGNSLTSTDNPNGAIFIFDADGDITITTPTTIIRPGFSSLFATDGDGTWTFNDMTITDQMGLNGGIDLFGQMGTVNFTNLNITTDSAGTGDATTAFLAGGNSNINVMGSSSLNSDGGGALVLINIGQINMTFDSITATNNLNSQIGFAGDDGIEMLNVAGGTLDVLGLTTIHNVDGVAMSMEDVGADVTLNLVDIDTTGLDAIIAAVVFDNTGELSINGGTVSNVGGDGFRVGSTAGGGTGGFFNLNNTTFTNVSGVIGRAANSTFSGTGNLATPFSCIDNGGNTGTVLFNGGADNCPN